MNTALFKAWRPSPNRRNARDKFKHFQHLESGVSVMWMSVGTGFPKSARWTLYLNDRNNVEIEAATLRELLVAYVGRRLRV